MRKTSGSGSNSISKTRQGIKNLTDREAEAIVGKDRESHQRDLFESIEKGDFPKWDVKIQIMHEKDASKCPFNPFDLTKIWPHKDYPLIDVGVMELNKNPENYFADIEQAAFNPANIVPGIGFSPDKMLQGRLFSYGERATVSPRRQPPPDPGQPGPLPGQHLSSGRAHAGGRKLRRNTRIRTQQLRRMAGATGLSRTAPRPGRRGRPLEPPRGR